MREIKFRAWDVFYKKWIEINAIDFEGKFVYEKGGRKISFDKVELQQFTGLKDKNGKDIYEGDIVKNTLGILNMVKFGNGEFYFIINEENSLKLAKLLDEGSKLRKYEPDEWKWHDCEAIGNIYENPELLEELK